MTRNEWLRIKSIAAEALEQPEPARPSFVASQCGTEVELRREVESLIDSTTKASQLYEAPTLLIASASAALDALHQFDNNRIGERIGSYLIVRELGAGGMGTAYLAIRADDEYEKQVAIKLIKRGMDTDAVLRRFRNERQILATLEHANIARLLDGGTTADGLPYFVMEYIDGVPIDAYSDTRRLSIRDRVLLFRRVCDAVQYAHEHRVVHRDLKPGNILVTADGTPKLMDFGISKMLLADGADATGDATLLARAMTPEFASPEQVRVGTVTAATDVYSLGVVLYELLTGHRPYVLDGRTLAEIEEIICQQDAGKPSATIGRTEDIRGRDRHPDALRRRLAGDLDTIVLKAIRKEPERRYADVKEFSDDLARHLDGQPVRARGDAFAYRASKFVTRHRNRVLEAALIVVVMGAIGALVPLARRGDVGVATTVVDSVAVMPLSNSTRDPELEYLSEGLTEGLITDLSQMTGLKVASRDATFAIKEKSDAAVIGRTLKVRMVLLGSLSPSTAAVNVTLELVDVTDGQHVWRETYSAPLSDLPGLRGRMSRAVSARLGYPDSARTAQVRGHSDNPEAYQLFLQGRYLWNKRTEEGFTRGIEYFTRALAKDPKYALAYSGLADCYNLLGIWGVLPPHEAMPKVKDAAVHALTIDDSLAEAHTSLAMATWVYDWNWDAAAAEFQRALEIDPNYATAHDWYAYYLASLGRFDEAIVHIRRAQDIDPVSLSINTDVGEIYYWAGRYDRAVEQLLSVIQVEPDFAMARNILGLTYLKIGRFKEAVRELESANRLATGPRTLSTLAYGYGLAGEPSKARRALNALLTRTTDRYTSPFNLAVAYAGPRDKDQALSQLEQAFNDRSDTMTILRVYPLVDWLRSEPRFQELLARVGAPELRPR